MDLVTAQGGFSGETYFSDQFGERTVVRIYGERSLARGPGAVDVDAAVLHLMRGIVPVPAVLDVRRPAAGQPALLITEYVVGERLDVVIPTLDDTGLSTIGRRLGELLDRLAHVPTQRAGLFEGPDLTIVPFPEAGDGLPGWVEAHAERLTTWSAAELEGLAAVAETAQDLLDETSRTCLVHGDVNLKNILVDPATLHVTALLDWEFAHSGHPATDTGNLLRFERQEAFARAVLEASGTDLDAARAADLVALVDLAARDHDDARRHPITTRAEALLRRIATTGDLHA